MKISLAWVFDHIDADWKKQNIDEIVEKFNAVTAEIEGVEPVKINLKNLFLGELLSSGQNGVEIYIPELDKKITLDARDLFIAPAAKNYFFILKDKKHGRLNLHGGLCLSFRWATCKDLGLEKEGLLPAFDLSDDDAKGGWRKLFESEDVILDVDNKSLTHRPDMWGHRGFAREIAAFLDLPLKSKEKFLADIQAKNHEAKSKLIEIKAKKACSRFAALEIDSIENKPSNLLIASRLIKVGLRPINGIVDLTNYVMFDWSQPVHAYDAEKISNKKLVARMAKGGETLELLDGQDLKLTTQDLVISDGKKAVGLAGVMGGLNDSISSDTKKIIFESAHFNPVYIRRTSMRHGIRTDSSTRFEKTLDPNQIVDAILRFVALCEQVGIDTEISKEIESVGKKFEEKTIGVTHSFLEKRSGVKLEKDDVINPLSRMEFTVVDSQETLGDEKDILYTITIPSHRGAKDVEEKEDILEEVIRFFGFNRIGLTLPTITKEPKDLTKLFRKRKIKNFLVSCARMIEQRNYIYYDEEFLSETSLRFDDTLSIKNPVSENNLRLATSLLPNLLKNIKHNCANENSLRFFESGRTVRVSGDSVIEEKKLAGIIFDKRKELDFYDCKQYLIDLFKTCDICDVTWKRIYSDRKVGAFKVEIFIENTKIGVMGKVDSTILCKLGGLPESDAFYFELDEERLLSHKKEDLVYTPISKFQGVTFDLSFMTPIELTVETVQKTLFDSNNLIEKVELIDFFDKEEWIDKRSVAFRVWVSHPEKTLEREEIEDVRQIALKSIEKLGAKLR